MDFTRKAWLRLLFIIQIFAITQAAGAASMPPITPLPKGVPAESASRGSCIKAEEWDQYYAYIDSQRVAASGCVRGVIAPSKTLESVTPYASGTNGSIYDCAKVRRNEFKSRHLDMFLEEVALLSERADASSATCAANSLYLWAKAEAITLTAEAGDTSQTEKDRMWQLAGLSSVYLKAADTRAAATRMTAGSSTKDAHIRSWLGKLANMALSKHNQLIADNDELAYVNTQFWRAYALLPMAILNQDPKLLEASRRTFLNAMNEIEDGTNLTEYDKGFLPMELDRLSKSLHYHAYAAYPIAGMAVLSMAYGCDFSNTSWRGNQIARLLRKTIEGNYRPAVFATAVKKYTGKSTSIDLVGVDPRSLLILTGSLRANDVNAGVISFVKKNTGAALTMQDDFHPRLGGTLSRLAEAAVALRLKSSAKLKASGLCSN